MDDLQRRLTGAAYLNAVTTLLQAARRERPSGGIWEAADLQWWWRRDQHIEPESQTFWLDAETPTGAVIFTRWRDHWSCDMLADDHNVEAIADAAWPVVLAWMAEHPERSVEMTIRDDDPDLRQRAKAHGFEPTHEVSVGMWMTADAVQVPPPILDGFRVRAWGDDGGSVHHLARRNGGDVAVRLAECSLYNPALDLFVESPSGDLAGYGLFWADPATRVGLVEPMRVEDAYQGRGVGRVLLGAGLARLVERGCTTLKVGYVVGNEGARRLYVGAGFGVGDVSRAYRRVGTLGEGVAR